MKKIMKNSGMKMIWLILLIGLTIFQGVILFGYYVLSPDRMASAVTSGDASNEIWLTSCGTEDLGVVLSNVRAAVVYITGRRTVSRLIPQDPIVFTPTSLTGDKMGSGLIFDSEGYILTNYHVIADTTDLKATIFGDKTLYSCEIISTSPETDLAVIKINTGFLLPTATIGNPDMLEEGDEVLAVGCPFSLQQSVTHGIISDKKRTVTIEGRKYIDLIQTDAVINSGNSGGPLVNMDGEVVGVNVAIYAPTRVYCGIGFAISINKAKLLMMKIQYLKGDL
ncbi:MamE-Nter2 [Candidatus Magnetomoraceae bacterium gMMP-15]